MGCSREAQGYPIPQNSKSKSASALNRFFNIYNWSTRGVIRTARNRIIKEILCERSLGRQPFLQVIVDLTTLEKAGKFKALENLICMYHGKRGLHLVVVYLVVGRWRERVEFPRLERKRCHYPSKAGIKNGQIFAEKINQALQRGNGSSRYRFW